MGQAALLACDWGTTNLRAWTLDGAGGVVDGREFDLGVSRLQPGEAERAFHEVVRPGLAAERLPAILCGMIGSNLGWTVVDYVACPAGLENLAGGFARVETGAAPAGIVPGVRGPGIAGGADVMRGEETQVLGWLHADPARLTGRRLICHPGTHAKWVVVEDGRIVRFATFMTGELFAVLRRHSVLRSDAPAEDAQAFEEGLAAAGRGDALAARLFTARARVAAEGKPADTTPSYLSGLLIGAEIAAAPALLGLDPSEPVVLLGDAELCRWYGRAFLRAGLTVESHDGEAAVRSGLFALYRLETER